ncbi:MAG: NUDIX domain-containing protein [Myxococcales bacterium]|nr:NUDIX domain-containing protein [Myxococcales bacterium]
MHSAWRFCPRCGASLQTTPIDGTDRLACTPACGFVHYDNPTPVVAAIVQLDDDVVLAQNHGWPDGVFGLVTGFLEHKEDPTAGVLREVQEELCVEGRIESLVGVYPFADRNQVLIVYHVVVSDTPTCGPELAALKRVPIAKLRPWSRGTGPAVADWLERVRRG